MSDLTWCSQHLLIWHQTRERNFYPMSEENISEGKKCFGWNSQLAKGELDGFVQKILACKVSRLHLLLFQGAAKLWDLFTRAWYQWHWWTLSCISVYLSGVEGYLPIACTTAGILYLVSISDISGDHKGTVSTPNLQGSNSSVTHTRASVTKVHTLSRKFVLRFEACCSEQFLCVRFLPGVLQNRFQLLSTTGNIISSAVIAVWSLQCNEKWLLKDGRKRMKVSGSQTGTRSLSAETKTHALMNSDN